MMDDEEIPFDPSVHDVVATKNRSWNIKHAGNKFYRDLLDEYLPQVQTEDEPTVAEYRLMADEIIRNVYQRKGRFLKLNHEDTQHPTHCTIMGTKAIINKVCHALKERHRKFKSGDYLRDLKRKRPNSTPSEPNEAKKRNPDTEATTKRKERSSFGKRKAQRSSLSASPPLSSPDYRIKEPNSTPAMPSQPRVPKIRYEARASQDHPIHPYALEIITTVCNQPNTPKFFQILDEPLSKYTIQNEPEKERNMRLQLRHRYVAAQASNMSPLVFSRKLLELWGGNVVEEVVKTNTATPATTTPAGATSAELTSATTGATSAELTSATISSTSAALTSATTGATSAVLTSAATSQISDVGNNDGSTHAVHTATLAASDDAVADPSGVASPAAVVNLVESSATELSATEAATPVATVPAVDELLPLAKASDTATSSAELSSTPAAAFDTAVSTLADSTADMVTKIDSANASGIVSGAARCAEVDAVDSQVVGASDNIDAIGAEEAIAVRPADVLASAVASDGADNVNPFAPSLIDALASLAEVSASASLAVVDFNVESPTVTAAEEGTQSIHASAAPQQVDSTGQDANPISHVAAAQSEENKTSNDVPLDAPN